MDCCRCNRIINLTSGSGNYDSNHTETSPKVYLKLANKPMEFKKPED